MTFDSTTTSDACVGISGPLWAYLGLSGPLWACLSGPLFSQPASQPAKRMTGLFYISTLGLSGPLWASLGISEPLWAALGLSGPFWASLGFSKKDKTITDSWVPSFPRALKLPDTIPDSWSPSVLRGPKLQDKKTRQYPTAGAPVFLEARNCLTKTPDNSGAPVSFKALWASASQPASPPARQTSA